MLLTGTCVAAGAAAAAGVVAAAAAAPLPHRLATPFAGLLLPAASALAPFATLLAVPAALPPDTALVLDGCTRLPNTRLGAAAAAVCAPLAASGTPPDAAESLPVPRLLLGLVGTPASLLALDNWRLVAAWGACTSPSLGPTPRAPPTPGRPPPLHLDCTPPLALTSAESTDAEAAAPIAVCASAATGERRASLPPLASLLEPRPPPTTSVTAASAT
jgi:hypothetical protein